MPCSQVAMPQRRPPVRGRDVESRAGGAGAGGVEGGGGGGGGGTGTGTVAPPTQPAALSHPEAGTFPTQHELFPHCHTVQEGVESSSVVLQKQQTPAHSAALPPAACCSPPHRAPLNGANVATEQFSATSPVVSEARNAPPRAAAPIPQRRSRCKIMGNKRVCRPRRCSLLCGANHLQVGCLARGPAAAAAARGANSARVSTPFA